MIGDRHGATTTEIKQADTRHCTVDCAPHSSDRGVFEGPSARAVKVGAD